MKTFRERPPKNKGFLRIPVGLSAEYRKSGQQGQFLAFIRAYTMGNYAGVAPSHAEFQRFFDLSPPSVNSMLIRLE